MVTTDFWKENIYLFECPNCHDINQTEDLLEAGETVVCEKCETEIILTE